MKKFLCASALSVSLLMGGCASTGGAPPPTISDLLKDAQQAAIAACGFAPAATTIANIVAAGNPGVMTATAIGAAICAAIAPPPKTATLLRAGRVAIVKGWTITPNAVNGVPVR